MTWWHDDMMTWWHDDMMTWWHDDMMTWWHDVQMSRSGHLVSRCRPEVVKYHKIPSKGIKLNKRGEEVQYAIYTYIVPYNIGYWYTQIYRYARKWRYWAYLAFLTQKRVILAILAHFGGPKVRILGFLKPPKKYNWRGFSIRVYVTRVKKVLHDFLPF